MNWKSDLALKPVDQHGSQFIPKSEDVFSFSDASPSVALWAYIAGMRHYKNIPSSIERLV